jgi:acyl-CoA dehydrogenase
MLRLASRLSSSRVTQGAALRALTRSTQTNATSSVITAFERAINATGAKLLAVSSNEEKQEMYSLYKQATTGDATGERPGMLDFIARAKWDGWNALRGMPSDAAMQRYTERCYAITGITPVEAAQQQQQQGTGRRAVGHPKSTRPSFLESRALPEEAEAFRETVRRYVERDIVPNLREWERQREVPREAIRKAGEVGMLGICMPEEYGGVGGDIHTLIAMCDEISRCGSGGVQVAFGTHHIALPPIIHLGTEEMKQRVLPPVIAGEKMAALCVTEPGGGSDVANLRTTASRDPAIGDYIVHGEKTFISGGCRADFLTVAVRTGGEGAEGVSLLLVDGSTEGLTRTKLDKMGWHCSDTAHLHFDGCRVPAANLIGQENRGFAGIMLNFNSERLMMAAQSEALARACYEEALEWAQQRKTFGQRLADHQVRRRHNLPSPVGPPLTPSDPPSATPPVS